MTPLPLGTGVRLLVRHPAGLLALDKPAGLAAHPNRPADQKHSLLNAPYALDEECYHLPDGARLFLLNRIDSPTSGLVLAATDPELAAHIKERFRENAVAKTYFAVVKGARLQPPAGLWRDRLDKQRRGGVVRAVVGIRGIPAVARYQWQAACTTPVPLSLLRLQPETGRTHQLRVQCAAHGHPIAGDKTYGDFAFNRLVEKSLGEDRLFLHAAALSLSFFWQGRQENFQAASPLPDVFIRLFPKTSTPLAETGIAISPDLHVRVRLPKKPTRKK